MYETQDDLAWLQDLLDRTLAYANPHLASIGSPERRLNARQVVRYLQGTKHIAFATVNARGEPRVSPLDGDFIRSRFTVSTGARAARLRHLRGNPACSAVHMDGAVVGMRSTDGRRFSRRRIPAWPTSNRSGARSTARARSRGVRASRSCSSSRARLGLRFRPEQFPE